MGPAFSATEYQQRLVKTRDAMSARDLHALVIGDPANMNWLTGFDAWSFYVPQIMLVTHDSPPVWLGRAMDAGAVGLTTHLPPESIEPYPETLVQREDTHPATFMGERLRDWGVDGQRVGYESDTYFFSPRVLDELRLALPNAQFVDADRLVNWARVVKSDAEIDMMRQASKLAVSAHEVAREKIKPGVRQCDLMAEIVAAQIRGTDAFGGDQTALSPLILAGESATTAHPLWTDDVFSAQETVALELGGTRKRYNAGLARTVQLGKPSQTLIETAKAVEEGLEAVLASMRPGASAGSVHSAWQRVLDRYGLVKDSRIGYSIGVGYTPDWGEHTVSLRAGECVELQTNMCIHVMLGMWMDDWGMELSETVRVTDTGSECLTDLSREIFVV